MPKHPFEDVSLDNEEFQLLMEQTGVKPLIVNRQRKQAKNVSLDQNFPEVQKYTGPSNPVQSKKRHKKKKNHDPELVLDLHGETCESSLEKVISFIGKAKATKVHSLIIITGKGLHSEQGQGILRKFVWDWLSQGQDAHIKNFRWAPERLGGSGAIIIEFL